MGSRLPVLVIVAVLIAVVLIVVFHRDGSDRIDEKPDAGAEGTDPTLRGVAPEPPLQEPSPRPRRWPPPKLTIRGRVVDEADRPLTEAEVRVLCAEWRTNPTVVDDAGRFTHQVVPMNVARPSVVAPGYLPWLGPWLGNGSPEDIDVGTIRLRPARSIGGQVVFEDDAPAPDIMVAIVPESDADADVWLFQRWTGGYAYPTTKTDDLGHFRFDQLPEGTYTLLAAWCAWNEAAVENVRAGRTDVTLRIERPVDRREQPPPTLPERILVDLRTEDDDRVPKCYTALFEGKRSWPGSQTGSRITVPAPAPGDYTLYVKPEDPRYAPGVLRRLDVRAAPYLMTLRSALTLEGEVQLDGEPVRATVQATGWFRDDGTIEAAARRKDWEVGDGFWKVDTDKAGRFRITGVAPGTLYLTAWGRSCRMRDGHIVVEAGAKGIVIPMAPHPTITFRVHAPDGRSVGAVEAVIKRMVPGGLAWERREMHWGSYGESEDESVHTFVVDVSDAEAEYVVTAKSESATADAESAAVGGIRPGDEPTDVYLEARPPLRVLVIDEKNQPVPGAFVALRRFPAGRQIFGALAGYTPRHRASPGWPDGGHTDLDGFFLFEGKIPPGPWYVLAQTIGSAQKGRLPRVDDDQESVRVVLVRGQRISGRVVAPEGESLWARFVEAWPLDGQQESVSVDKLPHSGRFEFTHLAPGRYVVVARSNESFHREEVNWHGVSAPVMAGSRNIRVPLKSGHRSTLEILDVHGTRLPHADVRVVGRYVDREVVADRDGLYQAVALPPGKHTFRVILRDSEPRAVEFEAGDRVTLRVP